MFINQYSIYNLLEVIIMRSSLVKSSLIKVIKKNIKIDVLLFFAICGVVIASLIPPQILKYIVDHNLVPKISGELINLAITYMGVLLFIGIFDFMKDAVLTVLGQKITKEIRLEMMEKLKCYVLFRKWNRCSCFKVYQ